MFMNAEFVCTKFTRTGEIDLYNNISWNHVLAVLFKEEM